MKDDNQTDTSNAVLPPSGTLSEQFDRFTAVSRAPVFWYEPMFRDPDNHLFSMPTPYDASRHMTLSTDMPGICFGRMKENPRIIMGKPSEKDGHNLVIGYSGSGKTTSVVNPTIEMGRGYRIFLDPKGELLKHHRQIFGDDPRHKRAVFDPFSKDTVRFDPFSSIREEGKFVVSRLNCLAQMLIPVPTVGQTVWAEMAISIVTAALIHYYFEQPSLTFIGAIDAINKCGSMNNLVDLILNSNDERVDPAKCYIAKIEGIKQDVLASVGMDLCNKFTQLTVSKECHNAFGSSRKRLLSWSLLNQALDDGVDSLDIFLELREDLNSVMKPLYGFIIDQLIRSLTNRGERTYGPGELTPVSIILDEFTLLGRLPSLEEGLKMLRSRGVTIVLLTQSLADIDNVYGQSLSRVIVENCAYKILTGCTDVKSQQYFADLIGTTELWKPSACTCSPGGYGNSYSWQRSREYIVQPHALANLHEWAVVVSPDGPFLAKKLAAYTGVRVLPSERR